MQDMVAEMTQVMQDFEQRLDRMSALLDAGNPPNNAQMKIFLWDLKHVCEGVNNLANDCTWYTGVEFDDYRKNGDAFLNKADQFVAKLMPSANAAMSALASILMGMPNSGAQGQAPIPNNPPANPTRSKGKWGQGLLPNP